MHPLIYLPLLIIAWSGLLIIVAGISMILYAWYVMQRPVDRRPNFGRWLIGGGSLCILIGIMIWFIQQQLF